MDEYIIDQIKTIKKAHAVWKEARERESTLVKQGVPMEEWWKAHEYTCKCHWHLIKAIDDLVI